MYKIASEKAQRGRDRIRVADISHAELPEIISTGDRLRNLDRAIQAIENEISDAKSCKKPKEEIKRLGLRKFDIQCQIKALKATQSPKVPSLPEFFIVVAEERLPADVFAELKTEAQRRCHAEYANAK